MLLINGRMGQLDTDTVEKRRYVEDEIKAVMLEGYCSAGCVRRNVKGRRVEITTFQGTHSDEYVVKEGRSGDCRLFRKGVMKLHWKEYNGKKVGGFTVFEKGRALRKESWESLLSRNERRYVGNWKGNVRMIIRRGEENHVVYRGGYDNEESLKREGEGYAYDEESGRVLIHGVWKNDELFQILQEFESENEMIEYEVTGGMENVSVLNRRPVYEGGYTYNESSEKYIRHGMGNLIDVDSGAAKNECEWVNGGLRDSVDLFGGWYVKGREEDSLWNHRNEVKELEAAIHSWMEWQALSKSVTEVVVSSYCCNRESINVMDLSKLKELKRIEIGNDCFEFVKEVKLIGLSELQSVVVGMSSFTQHNTSYGYNSNRHFYVKNCPKLRELKMGCYSFSDYSVCEIENVDALEVIEIGKLKKESYNFYYASLELKSILIHNE